MNDKMLGDTIRKLRKKRKLSRSKLAELIGVSIICIKKWETYQECPNITLVSPLAQLLDKTADSVLFLYYYDFVIGDERE